MPIFVADRVSHHVKMEMPTVLVNGQKDLVAGKCFFSEILAKG